VKGSAVCFLPKWLRIQYQIFSSNCGAVKYIMTLRILFESVTGGLITHTCHRLL